eukprot:4184161-Lingulodinium_polyedra.AAC.1
MVGRSNQRKAITSIENGPGKYAASDQGRPKYVASGTAVPKKVQEQENLVVKGMAERSRL